MAFFMYYILTIMRKQNYALIGYGMEAVTAFVISDWLVRKYAIRGASVSYLIAVTVLLTIFVLFMIYNIWRGKKENGNKHTFAICAYKESKYLEDCIISLKNRKKIKY